MDKIWIYDWKQRKLGEIVNRITRKNSKLISELPLTISAQQGLIDQNEFFDKRVASKDVSGYYLIKNGEFAYNKSTSNDAPWGAIKRLDRYENGVLSTLYIVFEIKDETLVNSDFLVAYYSTNLWYKGIHEIAAEGARNHGLLNIAPTDFFKTKLKLPADIEEQKEIGEYFKKIDLLITFHQCKLNILNKIYRYAWEQRKLGDITVKIGSGKTPSGGKNAYVETGIPLIRSQNVNGDKVNFADIVYIDEATDESMANSRVYTNDVLLNITGASIGRSAVYKGLESANVNQHVCIIRSIEGHQPDFIQLNLSSDNGQKQIDESQAGGGREGLNFQEIGKMQFFFPSLNEQKCIGRYFNSLDHLITLHQQKCKQLQIIRKFMLKNMFL